MFTDQLIDHGAVNTKNKSNTFNIQIELESLQYLKSDFRQTPVQIIDKNDHPVVITQGAFNPIFQS